MDWRIWFLPLSVKRAPEAYVPPAWFTELLHGILEARPAVLGLLANNPFPGGAPRFVRSRLESFTFEEPGVGAWWRSAPVPAARAGRLAAEATARRRREEGE